LLQTRKRPGRVKMRQVFENRMYGQNDTSKSREHLLLQINMAYSPINPKPNWRTFHAYQKNDSSVRPQTREFIWIESKTSRTILEEQSNRAIPGDPGEQSRRAIQQSTPGEQSSRAFQKRNRGEQSRRGTPESNPWRAIPREQSQDGNYGGASSRASSR
jgi:hypothetical protein